MGVIVNNDVNVVGKVGSRTGMRRKLRPMAKDFRSEVRAIAASFADQLADAIVNLVRASSIVEVLGSGASGGSAPRGKAAAASSAASPSKAASKALAPKRAGRGGKRVRRSASDIDSAVEAIVSTLKGAKEGLRAEQIRERTGAARKDLPLAIKKALADKKITKKGEKRATTYFAK